MSYVNKVLLSIIVPALLAAVMFTVVAVLAPPKAECRSCGMYDCRTGTDCIRGCACVDDGRGFRYCAAFNNHNEQED